MSHLEEEINNKIMINMDDENSQSGHCGKNFSNLADALTDSESNLATSSHENESIEENQIINLSSNRPNSSMSTNVASSKKGKSSNKNAFLNNSKGATKSNFPLNSNTFDETSLNKKKKLNPMFSSVIASDKNSPRSSSDAETYVDVESIDERAVNLHSLITQNINRNFGNDAMPEEYDDIVCVEEDNRSDVRRQNNEYDEDY